MEEVTTIEEVVEEKPKAPTTTIEEMTTTEEIIEKRKVPTTTIEEVTTTEEVIEEKKAPVEEQLKRPTEEITTIENIKFESEVHSKKIKKEDLINIISQVFVSNHNSLQLELHL